jgi:hypothetical protein
MSFLSHIVGCSSPIVCCYVTEAIHGNVSFYSVLTCFLGYVSMILFFPLRCTLCSSCVGIYVLSIPGYSVNSYSFGPIVTPYDRITERVGGEGMDRFGNHDRDIISEQ